MEEEEEEEEEKEDRKFVVETKHGDFKSCQCE